MNEADIRLPVETFIEVTQTSHWRFVRSPQNPKFLTLQILWHILIPANPVGQSLSQLFIHKPLTQLTSSQLVTTMLAFSLLAIHLESAL